MTLNPNDFHYYRAIIGKRNIHPSPNADESLNMKIHVVSIAHSRYGVFMAPDTVVNFQKQLRDAYLNHLTDLDFDMTGGLHFTTIFFKDESEALQFYLEVS